MLGNKLMAVILAASMGAAACGKAAKVYVTADTAVVTGLGEVKAAKDVRCDAGEIPADVCKAISTAFVPFYEAYLEVNRLALAKAPVTEIDAAVVKLKAAGVKFTDALQAVEANKRALLTSLVETALARFIQ